VDAGIILAAGVASGTILLFAAVGEIFSERAGVLNLGVEGMMLLGAMAAFDTVDSTGSPWLGLLAAMVAGAALAALHALITVGFQADQVVSGLALTFLGTGLARVLGEGLSDAGATALLPKATIPGLAAIPGLGPVMFENQSVMVYVGFLLVPAAWLWIHHTRPGLHLRAIGEHPSAADALGINVVQLRYLYVIVGGVLAGLAGATITLAISPGWFGDLTVNGQGWIAVGLVIFAQWSPFRAAIGAFLFGALRRLLLDVQAPQELFGFRKPFFFNQTLASFLQMLPYLLVVLVLVVGSRRAVRQRLGAPAALGIPFIRGERGA